MSILLGASCKLSHRRQHSGRSAWKHSVTNKMKQLSLFTQRVELLYLITFNFIQISVVLFLLHSGYVVLKNVTRLIETKISSIIYFFLSKRNQWVILRRVMAQKSPNCHLFCVSMFVKASKFPAAFGCWRNWRKVRRELETVQWAGALQMMTTWC